LLRLETHKPIRLSNAALKPTRKMRWFRSAFLTFESCHTGVESIPRIRLPAFGDSADVAVLRQRRLAVVRVTTSGLVTTPPKSFRMKVSISSSKPTRSDSCIIWVPEYESIRFR
jgi:hypothetical protein